jgi:hypothetical protein
MEVFGGFMVMMSIISLFLAVVWLIMPFVVFAIKGKQDRSLELLEGIDKRLAALEKNMMQKQATEPESFGSEQDESPAVSQPKSDSKIS